MINEKEMEEAQEEIYEDRFLFNGEDIHFDNDDEEEMYYSGQIKEAIKLGANWALERFLNDLWNPGKEVPEYDKWILVQYKNNRGYNTFFWEELNFFHQKNRWTFAIDRWLYIDDLLPKKGGEK